MEKTEKSAFLKYLFSLLLFGSNGIIASFIHLPSYDIVLLRSFLGGFLLLLFFLGMRQKFTFYKHKKAFSALCISGISMGVSWMCLYEAYSQVGVSIASLVYYCGPIFVMALSPIVFKERLTSAKVLSFIIVFCGILFINGGLKTGDGLLGYGIIIGLFSAITYASMVIFNKKSGEIKGLENAMIQMIIGCLTVAVFVFFKTGLSMDIAPSEWIPILILGLFNTGFGCYLFFSSLSSLKVQTVAICGYLEPLSAVVLSVLFLGERFLPLQIIGAIMILFGAMYAELRGRRN